MCLFFLNSVLISTIVNTNSCNPHKRKFFRVLNHFYLKRGPQMKTFENQ